MTPDTKPACPIATRADEFCALVYQALDWGIDLPEGHDVEATARRLQFSLNDHPTETLVQMLVDMFNVSFFQRVPGVVLTPGWMIKCHRIESARHPYAPRVLGEA